MMEATMQINQIMSEIEDLNYTDKLNLLSRVISLLEKPDTNIAYTLTDLKGLGKELWLKQDIDAYLTKERESWD
jgi:hypothetical protein